MISTPPLTPQAIDLPTDILLNHVTRRPRGRPPRQYLPSPLSTPLQLDGLASTTCEYAISEPIRPSTQAVTYTESIRLEENIKDDNYDWYKELFDDQGHYLVGEIASNAHIHTSSTRTEEEYYTHSTDTTPVTRSIDNLPQFFDANMITTLNDIRSGMRTSTMARSSWINSVRHTFTALQDQRPVYL
ncbi:hypothetical protein I203_105930 [Kwoniella mangroviensis CBS 8507]|uniref:uncharacterized protein n=1 Tax=Kwoniella mangroviensis CBS 8507 TaxID=1296122 RepID=UPI0030743E47